MGPCFIPPYQIEARFAASIVYTQADIRKLVESCPDPVVMKRLAEEGSILLPGPARKMNLKQIAELIPIRFGKYHDQDPFTYQDTVKPGWIAMTKDPLTGSMGLKWLNQRRIPELSKLSTNVPNAAEVAWCVGMFNHVRHASLLWKTWVNTASSFIPGNLEYQVKATSPASRVLLFDIDEKVDCGVLACRKFRK